MMRTTPNIYCQELPKKFYQKCPLCGTEQPAMMKGLAADMENGELFLARDKGYSFCNCKNIFYTDWKNINQDIYDDGYYAKYQCEDAKNLAELEVGKVSQIIRRFRPNAKTVLEFGAIHDYFMEAFHRRDFECCGTDILKRESRFPMMFGNIDEMEPNQEWKKDVLWVSHVMEHVKDPLRALEKMKQMVTKGGVIYIAMPDTFFIDFDNPLMWDWVVTEHHILWGMDSFIEQCEELGFKCLWSERNTDLNKKVNGEWFWKRDFKVLLCVNQ
jgi:SAM-dependent methyltransferase